ANDHPEEGYRATRAAINSLHKVMILKDEIYVAHLLTSEEKLKRDKERFNVDESNGDKIRYLHLNRPRFTIMGIDLQRDMNTRNWQLNLMKWMKFLRRWFSQWHIKEKEFRDWYIAEVVDTFAPRDAQSYANHVLALEVPEGVRGYREIRYPKMEAAKKKVEELLRET
ncbi:indolepyruvate ferredoxin oxidoreductase, partial [Candidatus Poribacteria bacterium]|nr:indolepyruvate ferredoxin oxidoreductase [Candidatus Poribacteria bacterium]